MRSRVIWWFYATWCEIDLVNQPPDFGERASKCLKEYDAWSRRVLLPLYSIYLLYDTLSDVSLDPVVADTAPT